MKTIVLFFVLVAFAGVSAFPSKKHKTRNSQNGIDIDNNDWPQPPSLGQFGIPEGFGGGPSGGGPSGEGPSGGGFSGGDPSGGGQVSGDSDNPSGNSRVKSSRRRN